MPENLMDYLSRKKDEYVKKEKRKRVKKLKEAGISEQEAKQQVEIQLPEIEAESVNRYAVNNWLIDTLSHPKRLSPSTHIGKYSHPDVTVALFIAPEKRENEYLSSGNFSIKQCDFSGNAGYAQYSQTLNCQLDDGRSVREHFEKGSEKLQAITGLHLEEYQELRSSYLDRVENLNGSNTATDYRLKQIYFPVREGYRLFSLIPSSTLIRELNDRIQSRQWKGKEYVCFVDYIGKTYGGANPQNISALNIKVSRLLKCFPPSLNRTYRLPKKAFFTDINVYRPRRPEPGERGHFQLFESLHNTLTKDPNTLWARRKKKGLYRAIIEYCVIARAESIRENAPSGWTMDEMYSKLSVFQKRWLDPGRWRESEPGIDEPRNWQDEIARQISYFVRNNYKRLISSLPGEQPIEFSDAALEEIRKIAKEYVQ